MPLSSVLTTVGGHWELQTAALLKAVWWDFRLADGLVYILSTFVVNKRYILETISLSSDRFPVPVRSAVKSNVTAWCCENLPSRVL